MGGKIGHRAEPLPDNRSSEQKEKTEKFINELKASGKVENTTDRYDYSLRKFLIYAGSSFKFSVAIRKADVEMERKNMVKIIGKIVSSQDMSARTKNKIFTHIKVFYKWLYKSDNYPYVVSWIKPVKEEGNKLRPDDLLTEEDIEKMLIISDNSRDKAIIALLYDTGIRIGELLNLRMRDIDIKGRKIMVNGKTGERPVPLTFSRRYLAGYIEDSKSKRTGDNENQVWFAEGRWKNAGRIVDRAGISKMLWVVAEKADIKKRIYPHLFRHSRATYYANKLTEQQLKAYFGWAGSSKMTETYIHLSPNDLDRAIKKANGEEDEDSKKALEPKLKDKECPQCKEMNTLDTEYCKKCGSPMDIKAIVTQFAESEKIKESRKQLENIHGKDNRETIDLVLKMFQIYEYDKEHGKRLPKLDDVVETLNIMEEDDEDAKTKHNRQRWGQQKTHLKKIAGGNVKILEDLKDKKVLGYLKDKSYYDYMSRSEQRELNQMIAEAKHEEDKTLNGIEKWDRNFNQYKKNLEEYRKARNQHFTG